MDMNLKDWTLIDNPPVSSEMVLIARRPSCGDNLLRGVGFFEDGQWFGLEGDEFDHHKIIAWHEYPELPEVLM